MKSRFFVDYRSSTITEGGEYLRALRGRRHYARAHSRGDRRSGERLKGRPNLTRDVTLYKSLGIAPQDLASAHYVLQKAKERGVGLTIDF